MKTESAVKLLVKLAQLDIDAVLAYDQAIRNIDPTETVLVEALTRFQGDHLRHVDDLSDLIVELGEQPPVLARDFKGFLIEGMTAVMSKVGTRAALLAMTQNEALTNATYRAALDADLPAQAKVVVKRHYEDEQRHIGYITTALKETFSMGSLGVGGEAAASPA